VVAGWYDLFQPSTFSLYRKLAAAPSGLGHALVAGPWSHSGLPLHRRTGDRDQGPVAVRDLHTLQRTWFDRHLLGAGDILPAAEVFVTGQRSWERFKEWPPQASNQRWYPASQGLLDVVTPTATTVSVAVSPSDPTPARGGRVFPWEPLLRPGAFNQRPLLPRGDVLWFVSEKLDEDLVVAGDLRLSAEAGGETPLLDIYAVLCEIEPAGAAWNLADGIRRSFPGRIDVVMGSIAHRFRAGMRLGVLIAFAAYPRFDLTFDRASCRTLVLGPGTWLDLPVLV
jgi:putative CocE/NonD family hydrolase